MKKLAIAGASVALAAMPVVGVFATDTAITSHVDQITLTVDPGCAFADSDTQDTAAFGNMTPGSFASETTDGFDVTCNGAWTLSALGGNVSNSKSALVASANRIESTDGAIDGSISNWKFRVAGSGTGITNSYTSDSVVPAATTSIATGTGAVSGVTFTPTYTVSLGIGQAQGEYSGSVTYTVAAN